MSTTETQQRIAYAMRYGIARTNRFQVLIPLPSSLNSLITTTNQSKTTSQTLTNDVLSLISSFVGGSANDVTRGLNTMIGTAELPGRSLITSDMRYNGDFYRQAYDSVYAEMPMTFNVSRDMYERNIIDQWINLIVDPNTHNVGYFDDYIVDITVNQLNEADQVVYSTILKEAFPILCNAMPVSNDDRNVVHRLQVNWAYKLWLRNGESESNSIADTLLSQTALGPIVTPYLANPAVKKGLDVLQQTTGINLTGEALNIYNQVDSIAKATTGTTVNTSVSLLNNIKSQTQTNGNVDPQQKVQVVQIIQNVITALGG